jgi:DNA sulfur modification protein DndD
MKRAILYMRVSTVDQHPESQLHDLRELARQRGYEIVHEYTDRISGTRAKRPGLDELMRDARRSRFDVVLVWASDRLARSVRHFLEVLDELNHLQIEYVSFRENLDTSGPLGRAMVVIIGAIAELERNLIVERVRAGMRRAKLEGRHINSPTRGTNAILEALDNVLTGAVREQKARAVHKVSASERDQIIVWIDDAMRVKPTIQQIGTELEQFYRELQKCERELARVPSDEVLKPFIDQLSGLHLQLGKTTSELSTLDEHARSIGAEIEDLQRRLSRETDEVASRAKASLNLERASDIHVVLDEYRDALMRRKVEQLQEALSKCFNLLSRKKDSVRTLRIDPADFSVHLLDRNQRPLAKSELSAGEKQIYAVAVLWGLAKISGRPLPLIVDTPLARLDSDHRQLLAENYFPQASQQVIVLSTDTEIDRQYFEMLRKHVSHSYMLEYVPEENGTVVTEGYFWNEVN